MGAECSPGGSQGAEESGFAGASDGSGAALMTWIETITPDRAEGRLAQLYDAIGKARSRVAEVHLAQSLHPGRHVAAEIHDLQVGALRAQERRAPHAR